jgi:general secretion pathway protein K
MMPHRRGFALMTVLWLTVAASAIALTASVTAREHLDGAQNRIDIARARWRANDCLERKRAAIDDALRQGKREGSEGVLRAWRRLDRVAVSVTLTDCEARLEASGARIDVNRATAIQLYALFRGLHLLNAESLTDHLLDWLDSDDLARPHGADRDWYAAARRVQPRNAPIANAAELRRIGGFEKLDGIDSVLGVDEGRLSVNNAPLVALATVPGFTPEVLERIADDRQIGVPIADVLTLAAAVSRSAADTIMARYPEVMEMVTVTPDAWIVIARGSSGSPPRFARIEATLVLNDSTASMIRRRLP